MFEYKFITNSVWAKLDKSRVHDTTCHYSEGAKCTARDKDKCIALSDTTLVNGGCPFFRDKTKMTAKELKDYERLASCDKREET